MRSKLERPDDFQTRRKELAGLSEAELEKRFWELADRLTEPMIELARTHTSPSIERSVLLRMGFSDDEAKGIVEHALDRGLLGKGAGHLVLKLAGEKKMDIREAGLTLGAGNEWETVAGLCGGGKA